jgi:hypothetical protein
VPRILEAEEDAKVIHAGVNLFDTVQVAHVARLAIASSTASLRSCHLVRGFRINPAVHETTPRDPPKSRR